MTDERRDLLDAIECCRMDDMCERCPLQERICDVLEVEMVKLPSELVDLIEEALGE